MQWHCCIIQANLVLFILAVRCGRVGVLMVVLADLHSYYKTAFGGLMY